MLRSMISVGSSISYGDTEDERDEHNDAAQCWNGLQYCGNNDL